MMKKLVFVFIGIIILGLIGIGYQVSSLNSLAASESFPEDTYLNNVAKKRALVVVAHDDDNCSMGGTLSKLNSAGWEVQQINFLDGDAGRNERHANACKHIMDGVNFIDLKNEKYRFDLDTVKYPYMPKPKEVFDQIFNKEEISKILIETIRDFKPTVIFSLDNEMGGYGHPDHVFISELVRELCETDSLNLGVQRIYQSVFTNSMEKAIMDELLAPRLQKWGFPSPYQTVKELYNLPEGMPNPDVEIKITSESKHKMDFLRAYGPAERKNIRKFLPLYEWYPHWLYFRIFDREFFRVVEL